MYFDCCQNQRPWMTLNGCTNDASLEAHGRNVA